MAIYALAVENVGRSAKPRSAPGPWLIRWSDATETWCRTKAEAMRIAHGTTEGTLMARDPTLNPVHGLLGYGCPTHKVEGADFWSSPTGRRYCPYCEGILPYRVQSTDFKRGVRVKSYRRRTVL